MMSVSAYEKLEVVFVGVFRVYGKRQLMGSRHEQDASLTNTIL